VGSLTFGSTARVPRRGEFRGEEEKVRKKLQKGALKVDFGRSFMPQRGQIHRGLLVRKRKREEH